MEQPRLNREQKCPSEALEAKGCNWEVVAGDRRVLRGGVALGRVRREFLVRKSQTGGCEVTQ